MNTHTIQRAGKHMCTSPKATTAPLTPENALVAGIHGFVPCFHTLYYYNEVL
jgi:hypothetical protein